LVLFLAIVRTHIDRDFKGDMARLPEPEYPTRLAKTFCKLIDAHALLYDREPIEDDLEIGYRLILDNIPTERLKILNTLVDGEERTTSEVQTLAKVSNGFARRVLEDLKALEIIQGTSAGTGHPDVWTFCDEDYRQILIKIQNFDEHENPTMPTDSEEKRGAKGKGGDTHSKEDLFLKVLHKNNINNNRNESHPVSGLPPALNQDAEPQQTKPIGQNCGICGNPLNGSSEQGPAGLGKIHVKCKYLPIPIRFLMACPQFVAIDERPYGSFKAGDIAHIPAINACGLIMRRAAEKIEGA